MTESQSSMSRTIGRRTFSDRDLRSCAGRFGSGVVVVTYDTADGARGITLNSFISVSLEPALVLVSIGKTSRSHAYLAGTPFTINILAGDQQPVARHFAGQSGAGTPQWLDGAVGPALGGTVARMHCMPYKAVDAGDHTLYLGEVVALDQRDGDTLGFHDGRYSVLHASKRWTSLGRFDMSEESLWI
ncbi:flavin reductase family protein [Microbacterium sp. GXF7504]